MIMRGETTRSIKKALENQATDGSLDPHKYDRLEE
jgi:hypothetical protein